MGNGPPKATSLPQHIVDKSWGVGVAAAHRCLGFKGIIKTKEEFWQRLNAMYKYHGHEYLSDWILTPNGKKALTIAVNNLNSQCQLDLTPKELETYTKQMLPLLGYDPNE